MEEIDIIYHLTGYNEKNTVISLVVRPKIHDLNLNMRKYQENKIWGTIQNNWPAIFKRVKALEVKERRKNFSMLKEKERGEN